MTDADDAVGRSLGKGFLLTFLMVAVPVVTLLSLSLSLQAQDAPFQGTPLPNAAATESLQTVILERDDGLSILLESISFRREIDGDDPDEDVFLILLARILGDIDDRECVRPGAFTLYLNDDDYDVDTGRLGDVKNTLTPERDFPGGFRGQCVDANDTDPTFVVFDVPLSARVVELSFSDDRHVLDFAFPQTVADAVETEIVFDQSEAAIVVALATETPLPTPTATATATATPSPTVTPTPTITFTPSITPTPSATPPPSGPTIFLNDFDASMFIERVELWPTIDGDHADRGVYMVIFATLFTDSIGRHCVSPSDFTLFVNGAPYDLESGKLGDVKDTLGPDARDFPGRFNLQCVQRSALEPTFLVFDIPLGAQAIELMFDDSRQFLAVNLPSTLEQARGFRLEFAHSDDVIIAAVATDIPPTNTPRPMTLYITVGSVNIRPCPGTDCAAIDQLSFGDQFQGIERVQGETINGNSTWWRGTSGGREFYVLSSFVSTSRPAPPSNSDNTTGGNTPQNAGPTALARPRNCAQAVEWGYTPEQAARWSHLDADNDGVACYGD